MSELLDRLERIAGQAGDIALSHYGRTGFSLKPGDASPVTAADREVEAFLARELYRLDPEAVFIGEESAGDPAVVQRARQAERVWVVDPVDGTAAFLSELDTFAVCIGLLRHGRPYAGVVTLPALRQSYLAQEWQGARWHTPRARATIGAAALAPPSMRCFLAPSNAHRSYRIRYPGKVRSFGCTAYHFLLVARGLGAGAVSRSHVWDYAAAAAVVEQAGAVMRYLDGGEIDWRDLLDGRIAGLPVLGAHPDAWQELAGLVQRVEG